LKTQSAGIVKNRRGEIEGEGAVGGSKFKVQGSKFGAGGAPCAEVQAVPAEKKMILLLSGEWRLSFGFPDASVTAKKVFHAAGTAAGTLSFDIAALGFHDSTLHAFLLALYRRCEQRGIAFDTASLPPDAARLLAIAATQVTEDDEQVAAERRDEAAARRHKLFFRLGNWALVSADSWSKALDFVGQVAIALWNFVRGRARTRAGECWLQIQACGADALPIVSLVSILTGLILTYLGVLQMRGMGAVNYVPGVVALMLLREMGVLMTGVILCGRTGTAYAAQLATMQVSEEIPALRVLGISPIEYLVLPRMLALLLMMPVLTLYANAWGIATSLVVCSHMGLTLEQSYELMTGWFAAHGFFPSLAAGMLKSVTFAVLIAWAGCFRGMTAGKSSQAVGDATTSAAVLGITMLVVGDAVFSVLFNAVDFYQRWK
jgi:phospholipid/cholesterol/gamma-HCH transport system permease protein